MLKRILQILSLSMLAMFFFACESNSTASNENDTIKAAPKEGVKSAESKDRSAREIKPVEIPYGEYFVENQSFNGVKIGDKIADHSAKLEKGTLKNGEGEFEVYYINDKNGNKVAYVSTAPNNKSTVSSITITSAIARTKKGNIYVGMPYERLEKTLVEFEAHGSEIESRTYITKDKLSYRLDYPSNQYDLDKNKIPKDSKITQIVINK